MGPPWVFKVGGPPWGIAVHIVMPWFFPLASFVAWLGMRSAHEMRHERGSANKNGIWMLVLMCVPLFAWLLVQFLSQPGGLP